MIKHKAIMIGAGLANMAAAVYLIQEAHWQGDQITFYSLDDHGSMMVPQQSILWMNIGTKIIPWKTRRAMLLGAVGC